MSTLEMEPVVVLKKEYRASGNEWVAVRCKVEEIECGLPLTWSEFFLKHRMLFPEQYETF